MRWFRCEGVGWGKYHLTGVGIPESCGLGRRQWWSWWLNGEEGALSDYTYSICVLGLV